MVKNPVPNPNPDHSQFVSFHQASDKWVKEGHKADELGSTMWNKWTVTYHPTKGWDIQKLNFFERIFKIFSGHTLDFRKMNRDENISKSFEGSAIHSALHEESSINILNRLKSIFDKIDTDDESKPVFGLFSYIKTNIEKNNLVKELKVLYTKLQNPVDYQFKKDEIKQKIDELSSEKSKIENSYSNSDSVLKTKLKEQLKSAYGPEKDNLLRQYKDDGFDIQDQALAEALTKLDQEIKTQTEALKEVDGQLFEQNRLSKKIMSLEDQIMTPKEVIKGTFEMDYSDVLPQYSWVELGKYKQQRSQFRTNAELEKRHSELVGLIVNPSKIEDLKKQLEALSQPKEFIPSDQFKKNEVLIKQINDAIPEIELIKNSGDSSQIKKQRFNNLFPDREVFKDYYDYEDPVKWAEQMGKWLQIVNDNEMKKPIKELDKQKKDLTRELNDLERKQAISEKVMLELLDVTNEIQRRTEMRKQGYAHVDWLK